jgi:CRP-like cAMP-binding protein
MGRNGALSGLTDQSIFESAFGGTISGYRNKQKIYSQGKTANTLFYIREGNVMLTTQSKGCRPAVITVLSANDFFGQSCLGGTPRRMCTATAIGSCSVLTIEKEEMIRILREDHLSSNVFVSYLLSVIKKYQGQMVDLLVNSVEKRLAHVLWYLAQLSPKGEPIPKISQSDLANMIGSTRSRTNLFMNQFKRQGFIEDNGRIKVHGSLRKMLLRH